MLFVLRVTELPLYSLRKPKRVRTAFSPAQLLHLERAFEQNRYVVGQERRQLAASLNLSETQVTTVMLTRPAGHEAKAEAEARKSEAEDEAEVQFFFETEAEARHVREQLSVYEHED